MSVVTRRSKSFLVAEVVREFIEWQIDETKVAIKEADNDDDFASEQEAQTVFNK